MTFSIWKMLSGLLCTRYPEAIDYLVLGSTSIRINVAYSYSLFIHG